MITFVIPQVPPSTQHVYRHVNRGKFSTMYLDKKGKQYIELVKKHLPSVEILTGPVRLNIELVFPNKMRRDVDNYLKLLFDAFNKRLYVDDSQVQILFVKKSYAKNDPKVVVSLEALD